jgi:hypothetical protein
VLVLEDGSYWGLYGQAWGTAFVVNGFFQRSATISHGVLTSAQAHDFGSSGIAPQTAAVSATYSGGQLAGKAAYAGGTTIGLTASALSEWHYDTPASLSAISGSWTFQNLNGSTGISTIAVDGSIVSRNDGCTATGTITPRASGKNVYDVRDLIRPCALHRARRGRIRRGALWAASRNQPD